MVESVFKYLEKYAPLLRTWTDGTFSTDKITDGDILIEYIKYFSEHSRIPLNPFEGLPHARSPVRNSWYGLTSRIGNIQSVIVSAMDENLESKYAPDGQQNGYPSDDRFRWGTHGVYSVILAGIDYPNLLLSPGIQIVQSNNRAKRKIRDWSDEDGIELDV